LTAIGNRISVFPENTSALPAKSQSRSLDGQAEIS